MKHINIKSDFAQAIRQRRRFLELSQEELAERSGLHRTYISDIERGARNLSLENINKLAGALEVAVFSLFIPPEEAGESRIVAPDDSSREAVEILLVEDSADDAEMTLRAFKKSRFTNRVRVVPSAEEALDYLHGRGRFTRNREKDHPRVILLDLHLPGMNGIEFLRQIKADERTKSIPVIVLTVSQRDRDMHECGALGIEAYIVKPVDLNQLMSVTPLLNLNWMLLQPRVSA